MPPLPPLSPPPKKKYFKVTADLFLNIRRVGVTGMRRGSVHAQEIEEGDEGTLVAGMEASMSNFCFCLIRYCLGIRTLRGWVSVLEIVFVGQSEVFVCLGF